MNALFHDRIDQLFQAVQENAARVSDQIAVLTQTVENCHDETHDGFEMVERQLSDREHESLKYMEAAEEQGWLAEREVPYSWKWLWSEGVGALVAEQDPDQRGAPGISR